MVDPIAIAVIGVGVLFLLFGSTFSSYGVSALGVVVGGSGGYLLGPAVADAAGIPVMAAMAGSTLAGAVVGVALSAVFLSLAVAAIAFVVGTYLGWTVIAGVVLENPMVPLEVGVAILVGLIAAVVAKIFTTWTLAVLTAFVGAALASQAVTVANLTAAAEAVHPGPLLFDVAAPLFVALFALGVLVQVGLVKFGYVTKVLTVVPGIRPLRKRSA